MARRGRPTKRQEAKPATVRSAALNAPFADLPRRIRTAPPARKSRAPTTPGVAEKPDAFEQAMEGVVPITGRGQARVDGPAPASVRRPLVSEAAEAIAALSDLVQNGAGFDVSDTREYVEGAIVGLDPRLLRRLRRGDFAWQDHLDLHGLTAAAAHEEVNAFLREAARAGQRCVLVVHGRGQHSKDQTPVLKERLKVWLARGIAAQLVLAFTTARPCDGGAGALYVLLRRDRRRRPIRVTEGAKR